MQRCSLLTGLLQYLSNNMALLVQKYVFSFFRLKKNQKIPTAIRLGGKGGFYPAIERRTFFAASPYYKYKNQLNKLLHIELQKSVGNTG